MKNPGYPKQPVGQFQSSTQPTFCLFDPKPGLGVLGDRHQLPVPLSSLVRPFVLRGAYYDSRSHKGHQKARKMAENLKQMLE